jgi:hypothetical protein
MVHERLPVDIDNFSASGNPYDPVHDADEILDIMGDKDNGGMLE